MDAAENKSTPRSLTNPYHNTLPPPPPPPTHTQGITPPIFCNPSLTFGTGSHGKKGEEGNVSVVMGLKSGSR
jgi:hypothetical protein